jgi:DNA-binding SARP family transcriptional activator
LRDISPLLIEIEDAHLRFAPDVVLDLDSSDTLARRLLDADDTLQDVELVNSLLAHDLLPDWTEDWVLTRRDHHAQLRVRALEALCLRLSALGRGAAAVEAGMAATACDPFRESAHRALMCAHLAEGNLAATAKQYEALRLLLWSELGIEPSAETKALIGGHRA